MSDEKTGDDLATAQKANGEEAEDDFKVEDRRHWQQEDDAETDPVEPPRPSVLDEFRQRAEQAENKLLEYIEAFKRHRADQEQLRERLARDVDRKTDLRFGDLVTQLLDTVDDLDLSLEHVRGVAGAEPLAEGVGMARDRFLAVLQKHGVERVSPDGETFDPNTAEALRIDPVDTIARDSTVTETLKPGYKLGDRVIRAAKVAVGRYQKPG